MSTGAAFSQSVLSNRVITESRTVANAVGCGDVFNGSIALKECLQSKTYAQIQQGVLSIVRVHLLIQIHCVCIFLKQIPFYVEL